MAVGTPGIDADGWAWGCRVDLACAWCWLLDGAAEAEAVGAGRAELEGMPGMAAAPDPTGPASALATVPAEEAAVV